MNYYSLLGVSDTATYDEIKKSYRRLAMQHHPDRGGDPDVFNQLQTAFSTLSDPLSRQEYDTEHLTDTIDDFISATDTDDIISIFQTPRRTAVRHNSDVSVTVSVSYQQVMQGTTINIKYPIHSGERQQRVRLTPGIDTGDTITIPGAGDDEYPESPSGDLEVTVETANPPGWQRMAADIITEQTISALDAITGCVIIVETYDDREVTVNIPAATQHQTIITVDGEGLVNKRNQRGDMYVAVKLTVPHVSDDDIISTINDIKERI